MRQASLPNCRPSWGTSVIALMTLITCQIAGANAGPPLLRCEISQGGGNPRVFEFKQAADPYSVKSVDIDGHFRFKAVMVGARATAYIKLYTYYQDSDRYILLHEAKYVPRAAPSHSDSTGSFTGINYLYSPVLGRELQYSCMLTGTA
ncbi:hypothetical protein CupriaWKF_22285 [Cupriavidus sp. WKF15]|uniref:hypothetical protein n=1 Tax=Cupriavidus sp. WKF15 TaxID=3032282 RepID=UPI0023E1223F|nr:hypothetical protein [Cupriavidus sp. WKF15]WER49852.1 hypothetical protein CupriaWKF_22285 [Cupriavidus sp. WKF15]